MSRQERRIVVGVDGSESSEVALRWAIRQAKLTGASVEAVIAWRFPSAHPTPKGAEGAAKNTLTEALAKVSGMEPDVLVRPVVTEGNAAEVLLRAARGADLLVVGSRGRGGLGSALLGSVSLYCVQHTRCPVLVCREGVEARPQMSGSLAGVRGVGAETEADTSAIEATGLAKRCGEIEAVRGVSFHVQPGEIFAFLRPNCGGKPNLGF